jgi:hypothetical protein
MFVSRSGVSLLFCLVRMCKFVHLSFCLLVSYPSVRLSVVSFSYKSLGLSLYPSACLSVFYLAILFHSFFLFYFIFSLSLFLSLFLPLLSLFFSFFLLSLSLFLSLFLPLLSLFFSFFLLSLSLPIY